MQGILTSKDESRNAHGVRYVDLLSQQRDTAARHAASLINALRAWLDFDAAKQAGGVREAKELRSLAMSLSERALL